jgi:hypothetical protein
VSEGSKAMTEPTEVGEGGYVPGGVDDHSTRDMGTAQ